MKKPVAMSLGEAILWMVRNPNQELLLAKAGEVISELRFSPGYGFQFSNTTAPRIWNLDHRPLDHAELERYVKKDYRSWEKVRDDQNQVRPMEKAIIDFVRQELVSDGYISALTPAKECLLIGVQKYIEQRLAEVAK